jgi:hypothetical protein
MSIDNNSNDPSKKPDVSLELVILILKEHEQILDAAINKLAQIPQVFDGTNEINGRLEVVNSNLDQLSKDLNQLKTLIFKP